MNAIETDFHPIVLPYSLERGNLPDDILHRLYLRLEQDGILVDLVPESKMTEEDFVEFVNGPALLSIFLDAGTGQFAGLAWITQIEHGDFIQKGCAGVAFFKDYRDPVKTRMFGRIVLGHWFNILGMNIVYAMTPASNKAAIRYSQGVGFRYLATLPGFTSRRGAITDGRIAYMTREEFNSSPD
jgi:hypothetical protein